MKERVCVFRADASTELGTGHVMRCKTLAEAMAARGWRIWFAAREMPALDQTLRAVGDVMTIPPRVDESSEPGWMGQRLPEVTACVTDSYVIGSTWQSSARAWAPIVVALDDLAATHQDVDVLVNQNLGRSVKDYEGLVPIEAELLVGPRYALLRPEFATARRRLTTRTGQIRRVLVFMSGSDAPNVTARAALASVRAGLPVDVVIGSANPHADSLGRWAAEQPLVTVHHGVTNMADLMSSADIAIGAAGSASWERCAVGLPAILVTLAENQVPIADALVARGCAVSLGWHDEVDVDAVISALTALKQAPDLVRAMAEAAIEVTDGHGASRVTDAIEAQVIKLDTEWSGDQMWEPMPTPSPPRADREERREN